VGIKRLADAEKGYRRFKLVVDRPDAGDGVPDFAKFAAPDAPSAAAGVANGDENW
jgi:hypothetical protein